MPRQQPENVGAHSDQQRALLRDYPHLQQVWEQSVEAGKSGHHSEVDENYVREHASYLASITGQIPHEHYADVKIIHAAGLRFGSRMNTQSPQNGAAAQLAGEMVNYPQSNHSSGTSAYSAAQAARMPSSAPRPPAR
ncbi:hypothetical protein ACFC09_31615 [Streptomyces sp. NPDC056161]|uniref:hypothetical protein n=1 Tax=Streptomyces sp. NPDC056161 TaxID=3345732 RepID=UPI0035D84143